MAKLGVMLANLGTPATPDSKGVRAFLADFLSDPCVVKLPRWFWLPLLYGYILPFRPKRVAKLYRTIWLADGSPLAVYSQRLVQQMQQALDPDKVVVKLAMTYGQPSIEAAWAELAEHGVEQLLVLPLFPQYSESSTGAVFAGVERLTESVPLKTIDDYYDHPLYIEALAASVRASFRDYGKPQRLLMSFHGIPMKNVLRGEVYPEHCMETAHLLADQLGLTASEWGISYQSRLGLAPWLQPYTDKILEEWAKGGVESVTIISPGFAVDCLETLEELAIQNKEVFLENGGKQFTYIPALNDSADHAKVLTELVLTANT